MLELAYAPNFVRQLKKLEMRLRQEAIEKIVLFRENPRNPLLRTHKLQGRLHGRLSFSVNYKVRIVFKFLSTKEAVLLAIGDHRVYDE